MIDAPLAWAFTAGLVATVNPCGFAMLPAYLSYFVGTEAGTQSSAVERRPAIARALVTGAVVSLGFLLVFGIVGGLVSQGVRSVIDAFPWLAIAIGSALVVLGVALVLGFRLRVSLPQLTWARRDRGLASMFLFGISYAVASLSCTLPIFLAVVAGTITREGVASGLVTFVAYGAGMSLVLLVLTIAIALANESVVDRIRGARRYIGIASGLLLVVAGGYIVYYWALALATEPGSDSFSRPASEVERISARLTNFLTTNPYTIGLILAAIVFAALLYVFVLAPRRQRSPEPIRRLPMAESPNLRRPSS